MCSHVPNLFIIPTNADFRSFNKNVILNSLSLFMDEFMQLAIDEAKKGLDQGGIPIGSVLIKNGKLVASGHNKRVQENNPILHGEMDCLNNAGRIGSYRDTVIYSTLMPCYMCAGTIVQFKIPKVIVGESKTFSGAREFMEAHGVEVIDLNLAECINMMETFIRDKPSLWNEDIMEL
jgi:cytosine deaminase